jgi:hypothetical protein
MRHSIVILALLLAVLNAHAQSRPPLRSLTPGNLFVYSPPSRAVLPFPPGIPRRAHERVLRDTLINNKRYGVVYSSITNSTRLERSDSTTIYELRNGQEIITHNLNWKEGDTIRFKFLWHGCDTCRYRIAGKNSYYNTFFKDSTYRFFLEFLPSQGPPPPYTYIPYTALYGAKYGLRQLDTGAADPRGGASNTMIDASALDGSYIDGVLDRDTNTVITSVQQPAASAQQTQQQPFSAARAVSVPVSFSAQHPFSEQTQLSYTLPSSGAVEIAVYSMQGIRLTTLRKERQQAGAHNVLWNGKSSEGADAPSGTYFFVLYFNDQQAGELQVVKTK